MPAVKKTLFWVKWLRIQGHRLPATLEVTGSNPGPSEINLIEKNTNGIPDPKKSPPLYEEYKDV